MPTPSPDIIAMAKPHGISFPVQRPIYHSPPNYEHLAEWANSQILPGIRDIAHTAISNLRYVPFEEFLSGLKNTIADFNQTIDDEPYVLLIGVVEADKITSGGSDQWVTGLALESCELKPPAAIVNINELFEFLDNNPDINNILMLDDSAYSGSQKNMVLYSIQENMIADEKEERLQQLNFHIGIPFLTKHAKDTFLGYLPSHEAQETNALEEDDPNADEEGTFANIIILQHQIMPSMIDVLSSEQQHYANQIDMGYIDANHVLTYFDHKFADYASTFEFIYEGYQLISGSQIDILMNFLGFTNSFEATKNDPDLKFINDTEFNELAAKLMPNNGKRNMGYNIPVIISPYKFHGASRKEYLRELQMNIEKGLVGRPTSYPITDSKIDEIVHETMILQAPTGYKTTILSTEQQLAIDQKIKQMPQATHKRPKLYDSKPSW
jgi:hypothetical protein